MSEFTSCNDCARQSKNGNCIFLCKYNKSTEDMFVPKKKKIIDLLKMVGSDIDCEFASMSNNFYRWASKLKEINDYYVSEAGAGYHCCRIRENHWHSWQGGECPLPEGLYIEVIFRNGEEGDTEGYYNSGWNINWHHQSGTYDIIAFKVIGVADGWKYEWDE